MMTSRTSRLRSGRNIPMVHLKTLMRILRRLQILKIQSESHQPRSREEDIDWFWGPYQEYKQRSLAQEALNEIEAMRERNRQEQTKPRLEEQQLDRDVLT